MAISRSQKTQQLESLQEKLSGAAAVGFVIFTGPTVNESQTVRRQLREKGLTYTVIKKSLISLAAEKSHQLSIPKSDLNSSVAVITSAEDEIAPFAAIKTLSKDFYNKETKTSKFAFAGGIFGGEFIDAPAAAALADIPSRPEIFSKIVGALRAGPRGIHSALGHGLRTINLGLKEAAWSTAA